MICDKSVQSSDIQDSRMSRSFYSVELTDGGVSQLIVGGTKHSK